MDQCKVILDNYNGQYFPGSQIHGRVLVNLYSQTTLRGIKVRLNCREHTSWIGTKLYYSSEEKTHRSRDVQFEGNNDVINNEIMLYGGTSATTSLTMGQHIYPFVIQLPPNMPNSYQCDKGSIIYKIIAIVDRPMALDYEDQIIIVINSPVDLNSLQRPNLLKPSSYSDEKTICCWCCAQGPISIDVELPKKTLVPGQTVKVTARVQNMSNSKVKGVSLELSQLLTFKAQTPNSDSKTDTNVLVNIKDSGVGAHGENTYNFKVTLPPYATLPNFSQCRLFKVEYLYKVVAHLPGLSSNLEIKMYPKVGHIEIGSQNNAPPSINPTYGVPQPAISAFGGQQVYPPMPMPPQQNKKMGWSGNLSVPRRSVPTPPSYERLN